MAPDKPILATLIFDNAEYGSAAITSPRVVVGRHSGDDIRVNDIRVSRHHALLTLSDGGTFEIHNQTADRSSANPIQINGEVLEHAILKDGDKVLIGGVPLTFRLGGRA